MKLAESKRLKAEIPSAAYHRLEGGMVAIPFPASILVAALEVSAPIEIAAALVRSVWDKIEAHPDFRPGMPDGELQALLEQVIDDPA